MFGLSVVLAGISRNFICFPKSTFPSEYYVIASRPGEVPGSDDLLHLAETFAVANPTADDIQSGTPQMCSEVPHFRKGEQDDP